jgi:hypothetical protein
MYDHKGSIRQVKLERIEHVSRGYELLTCGLSGECWYLIGTDYMCVENHTAFCTGKWTCNIGFRGTDFVCNSFRGAFGKWRSRNESWKLSGD